MMSERQIYCELDIEADLQAVWAAITQAEHVSNWFAPHVDSSPGVGGYISLSWNDPASPHRLDIVGWDEGVQLQTTWFAAPGGETPINLPLSIDLESLGKNRTRLKLTQSGFLTDESWDDEFESHSRGWNSELRSLRYYLESQYDRTRQYFLEKIPLDAVTVGLDAIVGVDGVFAGSIESLAEGQTFNLRVNGEDWQCRLLYQLSVTDLVFICDALDGGMVRLAVENLTATPELWFWAFSWRLPQDDLVRRIEPVVQQVRERFSETAPL
jgi:uncharacterized protein YndB with AHSA1/START domain